MSDVSHIFVLADCYMQATGLKDITLSHRVFGDSKKMSALRGGSDITLGRFNAALIWFSANWPEGIAWPDDVERPTVPVAA